MNECVSAQFAVSLNFKHEEPSNKFFTAILAIFVFFSCGEAKKKCKSGQVNYASQHFYMIVRSKCN